MKNVTASIRDRLLQVARQEGIQFQRVLTLYKQEGLLHRIVSTDLAESVVLKGGLLFFQLKGLVARPTKDIDLLGTERGADQMLLLNVLRSAAGVEIDDGLTFDPDSIVVAPISGQTEHGGVRGNIVAYLGSARTRLQIDMGFGDIITGGPIERPYRTLLGNRSFSILAYPDATLAAEKMEAVVSLGVINSRYKDLFDLFALLVEGELSPEEVAAATGNTFRRRGTALPEMPDGLSVEHWESAGFATEWSRFLRRIGTDSPEFDLLRTELLPRLLRIYQSARAMAKEA